MAGATHEFMLQLLQACAERAPEPLYPATYAKEQNLDRDKLDDTLDELRRRGLVQLTEWVKDHGQGRALTEAGKSALASKNLAPVKNNDIAPNRAASMSVYERGEIVRDALFEPSLPWVSRTLVAINLVCFLYGILCTWKLDLSVMEYLQGGVGRVNWELGALYLRDVFPPLDIWRPEFERLIFCCFLHFGVLHLGMNMYSLATLGDLVESMWGKLRFALIYLISGFVSSCVVLSIEMVRGQPGLTAGASGPIYGVFASMLVWFGMNYRHLPDQFLQTWARTLAINVFIMLAMNSLPGISWQAHLGGAIGGALAAFLLQVQRFDSHRAIRILALLGVPLVPALFFLLILWQAGWLRYS